MGGHYRGQCPGSAGAKRSERWLSVASVGDFELQFVANHRDEVRVDSGLARIKMFTRIILKAIFQWL